MNLDKASYEEDIIAVGGTGLYFNAIVNSYKLKKTNKEYREHLETLTLKDLKDMYQWVKPRCVIPVHGEHRHMIEHINFAKEMQVPHPVQVENGDIVKLYPGEKPEVYDKAPSGRLYLDGSVSVDPDSQSIKDRKNLSYNGFLEITIIVNDVGSIVKKPIISFKGIPSNGESSNFVFDLEDKIRSVCKTFSLKNSNQEQNLIEALKTNCRKTVKEKTGKRPYTNVNLVRI